MLLKQCPICGCDEMVEIPEIGCKCSNCDEIFKYDDNNGYNIVSLAEWVEYLSKNEQFVKQ